MSLEYTVSFVIHDPLEREPSYIDQVIGGFEALLEEHDLYLAETEIVS